MPQPTDRDYVLGTHDKELIRLGIQHGAWRPIALDCWRRAGVSTGSRVLDVGAGPGYATLDLAEIVGPSGEVAAVERSARFVEAGRASCLSRGYSHVHFYELDLMSAPLPSAEFDFAWCRWVASFVESPRVLVDKIADAVRVGGSAVFHEYVDYGAWRFSPPRPLLDAYVACVMGSWRASGGEPDVATSIPPLLGDRGFVIRDAIPLVFCVRPGDSLWRWISTFVDVNLERLLELGHADIHWIDSIRSELRAAGACPNTLMITPMVLEIIADRAR